MEAAPVAAAAAPPAAPPSTPPTPPETSPVTFTTEQQSKLDQIIRDAMSRAGREARKQAESEKEAREKAEQDLREAREQVNSTSEKLRSAEADRDSEITRRLAAEKSRFIAEACHDHHFVDVNTVVSLTESQIEWDESKQSFRVVGSDASTAEFFADFAQKRPYMVRSDVRTGPGSHDSSRSSLPITNGYKVEQIFGKGSNARLANELAKKNPAEYARLKAEAKARRLI